MIIMSTDQQHFDASGQFQAYYDETLRRAVLVEFFDLF